MFLSAPTVLSVVLPILNTTPAHAIGTTFTTPDGQFCAEAHSRLVCVKSSQLVNSPKHEMLIARAKAEASDPDAFLNFTEEESEAAAAMFNCDCPACLRSLRQLRIMAQVI